MKSVVSLMLVAALSGVVVPAVAQDAPAVSHRLHAFYYPWYGNPETDGEYHHWSHAVAVRQGPPRAFPGGEDIAADFYPALGCYSSNSPADLDAHMKQLRRAGVGVASVSWWGKDSYTDLAVPKLLDAAAKAGLRVNFHIEPFPGRSARSTRDAIAYLIDRYGSHPAFYRNAEHGGRPMFYVYDSYLVPPDDWATVLAPSGKDSIRGTPLDAVVIGLWVKEGDGDKLLAAGFDGFYTYFAVDGFVYGSTPKHWPAMAAFAREHKLLFIPSVGPGYDDERIRPWNGGNTRSRDEGKYYDRMFQAALDVRPEVISITSFNEWHEGTQIEPAVPKTVGDHAYQDYRPLEPEYYLDRTRHWMERFVAPVSAGDAPSAAYPDHRDLSVWRDVNDAMRPIKTPADWAIRRGHILAGMQEAMGPLPDRSNLPPMDVQVRERVEGDGFTRLTLSLAPEAGDRLAAHLYLPAGAGPSDRRPAMLRLHPTSELGKARVAMPGGEPNRGYADELARRGYVVLAPDYPSFGEPY